MLGDAYVGGQATVYGRAIIGGQAEVLEEAKIYGRARILQDAQIYSNSRICGGAVIWGDIIIGKYKANILIDQAIDVQYGYLDDSTIRSIIKCSLNIVPDSKGCYHFYKKVDKIEEKDGEIIFGSLHDIEFTYRIGQTIELKEGEYDEDSSHSCSSGLHVSTPTHWLAGDSLLLVEVYESDIITCLEGKVRCKKLKVLDEIK